MIINRGCIRTSLGRESRVVIIVRFKVSVSFSNRNFWEGLDLDKYVHFLDADASHDIGCLRIGFFLESENMRTD